MTPKHQSWIANLLMVVGRASWIAIMGWVIAILTLNTPGESPRVVMLDPISMVGLMIAVYVSTVVLSGVGLLWSGALTRKYPNLCSNAVTALRAMIGLVMGVPALWLAFTSVFNMS